MNRKAGISLAVLAGILGWLALSDWHPRPTQTGPQPAALAAAIKPASNPTAVAARPSVIATSTPPAAPLPAGGNSLAAGEPAGTPENSGSIAPAVVLQNVRRAVRQYGEMFKGNPVGTNPEITAALSGKNPKQINFIDNDAGMRVNESGEMIDPWGTPYFFHQISGEEMEIHSAGPDRIMWTPDDLVAR